MFSSYRNQELFADPLTDVLRNGARALLAQAVEAEATAWLSAHADKLSDEKRKPPTRGSAGRDSRTAPRR